MKTEDGLYFAPHVLFKDVDVDGPDFPEQLGERIAGFYLEPAKSCCDTKHAFAAGVLLMCSIDALARYRFPEDSERGGERFRKFAREQLQSFREGDLDDRLYKEVRCGLVHEARLKKGVQFSFEKKQTVDNIEQLLVINPQYLVDEVQCALKNLIKELESDADELAKLVDVIRKEIDEDLAVGNANSI